MTREELHEIDPGARLLIKDHFVESPHEDLFDYLGTIQTVKSIDWSGDVWISFENVPQPFALSEIECVVGNVEEIDENEYDPGDMYLIFGEVR